MSQTDAAGRCFVSNAGALRAEVDGLLEHWPTAVPHAPDDPGFSSPWELRAFSIGVAAHRAGHYPWPEFQRELIGAIQQWEDDPGARSWNYYARWIEALEAVVTAHQMVSAAELEARTAELLAAPASSDHRR